MAQPSGISINLISQERLTQLSSQEKIRFILEEVKRGCVLVLERGLTATEEAELIKTTMTNIDQDTFIGIEMQSYTQEDVKRGRWLSKLLRRKQQPRMSVIGPADLLKTIHKDGNMIQAMILTRKTIMGEEAEKQEEQLPADLEGMKSPDEPVNEQVKQVNERSEGSYADFNPQDSNGDMPHPEEKKDSEED